MSKKIIFRIVLIFLIALFSFLSWWSLRRSLWTEGDWLAQVLLPFFLFLIFSALSGIFFIVEDRRKMLMAVPAAVAVSFLVVFAGPVIFSGDWEVVLIILLSAALMVLSTVYLEKEKKSRMKLSFDSVLRSGLRFLLTAVALLASLGFYYSPSARADIEQITIPRDSFDKIMNPILRGTDFNFSAGLPSVRPSASPSYLFSFITDSVDIKPAGFRSEEINRQIGDNIYQSTNHLINNLGRPYKRFLPLGLAISFFFAVKILQIILMWLAVFFAWILFEALIKARILSVKIVPAQKEVVEIAEF